MTDKTCRPCASGGRVGLAAVLLLLATTAAMLLNQPPPAAMPPWAAFAGRFHVVVLHFPIGLLAVAALLSLSRLPWLASWLPATPPSVVVWLTGLGALSAWLAAALGWCLAHTGGYEGELVRRHFYAGAACAAAALVAWGLAQLWASRVECRTRYLSMVSALAAANLLVVVAGHWGGSLTHGEHFLWEATPQWLQKWAGITPKPPPPTGPALADQPVYGGVIAPLLKQFCVECHNEQKAKGGLQLDHYAGVREAVQPGQPAASELLKRMRLPLDDEDHMPPPGKPQPTPDDLAILDWWIAAGAPENTPVRSLQPPPAIRQLLQLD